MYRSTYHRDCKTLNLLTSKWKSDLLMLRHLHLLQIKNCYTISLFSLLRRQYEVVLWRLRFGHSRLTHGHFIPKDKLPICNRCRVGIIKHLFLSCLKYDRAKSLYLGNRPPLATILSKDLQHLNSVLLFLYSYETDIISCL